MSRRAWIRPLLLFITLAAVASSCAYYNTFYLARRHYDRALNGLPYALDKTDLTQGPQFGKTIEYSRKVRETYPRSKWVDDAYLLEARALMGNDDPLQAVKLLDDFDTRHPGSPLRDEARFYLGVALRQSRKYERSLQALDAYVAARPRSDLAPFAHLERSRALSSLDRPADAAAAAALALERWGKNPLAVRARIARAEALLAAKQNAPARDDFRFLGTRAANDEDRLTYLLRESECLEVGQRYDEALNLLRDAIAHEREPVLSDTIGGRPAMVVTNPGYDRYGRLLLRIGAVQLRAEKSDEALASFQKVVDSYPRTGLAAEGQYRIGYAYETVLDDFDKARAEYGKVQGMSAGSTFADQSTHRVASLERLTSFRNASGGDTLQRKADGRFLLAEQYLFQLEKPERALEEYRSIEQEFAGTPYQAKAILAQGWVLSRKLDRAGAADSMFWAVVHHHAGTEAQLAARDYLEQEGVTVPVDLIRLPEPALARADTMPTLTPLPEGSTPLGGFPEAAGADSSRLIPPSLEPPPGGGLAGPGPAPDPSRPPLPGIRPPSRPPERAPLPAQGTDPVARTTPVRSDSTTATTRSAPAPPDSTEGR